MEHDVKDMLEIAIANNDYLWEVAVIDRLHDELERLYSQEAKAKAWDKYKAHMERYIAGEVNEEELVSDLTSDYFESGGSDD